jgi:hypothetical protein
MLRNITLIFATLKGEHGIRVSKGMGTLVFPWNRY